jgi:two-component system response regulator NreC
MTGLTTILLADDHEVVRRGLRALVEAEEGFKLIGETGDGLKAVTLVERLRPDVLVVDVMMPGLNGLDVTLQVTKRSPDTKSIVLSMHSDQSYVLQALRNGASGYVLKESSADELVRAIKEVTAGRRYLSPPLSEHAIQAYVEMAKEASLDPYETLTDRERQVLHLAAEGCNNVEVAARLCISPRTAETHRTNLMRKLDLHGQTDLVRYALRRGVITIEE